MWDTKRQIIWLATGVIFGTFILARDAYDDAGRFVWRDFILYETILLVIISVMFYFYSRKSRG